MCGSSRASLLTGLRPTLTRFYDWDCRVDHDAPGIPTFPALFEQDGYRTVSDGKVFHHVDDSTDCWSELPWKPANTWTVYRNEDDECIARNNGGFGRPFECAEVEDSSYPDGTIADRAIQNLQRLAALDTPFFCAVGFCKPHLPLNCPSKYWELYDPCEIDVAENRFRPQNCPNEALSQWGELRSFYGIPQTGPVSDECARKLIHAYRACVSYTDAQIGRLLAELDRLGLADNTIVVLWGDNGFNLGEHGQWCKHTTFETSLRVPLIMRVPGIGGGRVVDSLAESIDIYPTLCELCNLGRPDHLDGESMAGLLSNPSREWKQAVFGRYYSADTVKTDRYRYTAYCDGYGKLRSHMLYDHYRDPDETVNVADLAENGQVVADLQSLLGKKQGVAISGGSGWRYSGGVDNGKRQYYALSGRRLRAPDMQSHAMYLQRERGMPGALVRNNVVRRKS